MSTHYNNVAQTVSGTPGTGTITLGSAVTGAQTLGAAAGGNATVDVFITDGSAWEVARNCVYTHSGTTLTRGTLEASSTGSALSLTSSAVVRVALPATKGNRLESALQAVIPGGRLTTESGVPVSTSDRTAQSTLYYTPYVHNVITLWDGGDWVPTTFSEVSLALSGLTSGRPYDVFGYLSSGALTLELLAWTNDTTRATAVTLQDGRYCKSGDKTRLLLGTIYTTGTTTTADSAATRYVVNLYNQIDRLCSGSSVASHTYTTTSWREWNNGTSVTQAKWVCPIGGGAIKATGQLFLTSSNADAKFVGLWLNGATMSIDIFTGFSLSTGSINDFRFPMGGCAAQRSGLNSVTAAQYGATGVTYQSASFGTTVLA